MDARRKSALYREVNLATEALLAEFGSDDPGHFLCECEDPTCARQVELTRAEYSAVRLSGGALVSLECVKDAAVLNLSNRYASVAGYCSSIEK